MPQTGELNLNEVKAHYNIPDVTLCDIRDLDRANDHRLTAEITSGIGLTLLGVEISQHNITYLVVTIVFLGFGLIEYIRYFLQVHKLRSQGSADIGGPASVSGLVHAPTTPVPPQSMTRVYMGSVKPTEIPKKYSWTGRRTST